MTRELRQVVSDSLNAIVDDIVGQECVDLWWDLMPFLSMEPGPQGPQPASRYLLMVYTDSPILAQGGRGTVSVFELIVSPLQLLNDVGLREVTANLIRAVREHKSNILKAHLQGAK